MINVTRTFLPPIEEYQHYLEKAWDKKWMTNRGALVLELEEKLRAYLSLEHILITNNGTIPLQIALKLLGNKGEIITTPFSYVATTSSIVWEGCTPVFVDIDPLFLTIDEEKIEKAITEKTTAILATHVFGNPCNVERINAIAEKYDLKVIYDAAHAFGVTYKGRSLFDYGDISTCSFHATKIFHTGEGGAIFTNDQDLKHKIFYSHNFGHNGHEEFYGVGINAKISELQAAMGLAVLPYMKDILLSRKERVEYYRELLKDTSLKLFQVREGVNWNYSYFPVRFNNEEELIKVMKALNEAGIHPRRYFYPSLNKLNYLKANSCPVSEQISSTILCLPLYHDIALDEIATISGIIKSVI